MDLLADRPIKIIVDFNWLTGKESADQIKDMVNVIYTMSNK